MLGQAIIQHWHALVRDVLALGYRTADMFTTLSVAEMVAIVVGAPPGSSLRYFMEGGWSRTDHLLANMQEGQMGLANLSEPYQRPGLDERSTFADNKAFNAEVMTWDEMDERNKKRYAMADDMAAKGIKPTNTRVRVLKAGAQ